MKALIKFFANANILVGLLLMALPVAYLIAINTPQVWYRINPNAVEDEIRTLSENPFREDFGDITLATNDQNFQEATEKDTSLPSTNTLRIGKIGVNTAIREGNNEEAALAKGVWRMPGYGNPINNDKPLILAAHRWGPTGISDEYRNTNMFINLPQMKPGDEIEVIWDQKLYKYEVKKATVENNVSQLNDLILITCQYYNSPERIIVYADRVE